MGELTMPAIAIGGGFALLIALAGIAIVSTRTRSRPRVTRTRRTRLHTAVIDPRVAALGRAAFEDAALEVRDDQVVEVVERRSPPPPPPPPMPTPQPVADYPALASISPPRTPRPDMRVRVHYLGRETPPRPRRIARGSTPALAGIARTRADDWDLPTSPAVTAQLRADRR